MSLDQLKGNLQYWENLALKSHWAIALAMIPAILSDSFWAGVPLLLVGIGYSFVFFKHMSAKHRVDTFGRDD
jgi:hypothetical protein